MNEPLPLFAVARHQPVAADGVDWYAAMIAQSRCLVRDRGYLTPDDLRRYADLHAMQPPASSWWGCLFAKLRALGLRRTSEERTSSTPSRNAARVSVYRPGAGWRT